MDDRSGYEATQSLLDMLQRHGIVKITELIDKERLDEARQVADVLARVGLI